MKIKEYFKSLDSLISEDINLNNQQMKLQLITPYKNRYKSSFTLVINGYNFLRVKGIRGAILYEFLKEAKEFQTLDEKAISTIAINVSNTLNDVFPSVINATIKNELYDLLDEIGKRCNHEKNKEMLLDVSRYSYSMHYMKAFGIRVLNSFEFANLKYAYDTFKQLKKDDILVIEYDNECYKKESFMEVLSLNKGIYQTLIVKDLYPTKELNILKTNGLNQIILDIDSLDSKTLGLKKEYASFIKAVFQANLNVMVNIHIVSINIDYLKLIKELHQLGVYSYQIDIKEDLENASVILKRLYFYMNMYHFNINLLTNNVIPQKELKRINMNLGYQEEGVSWYYLGNKDGLYLDRDLNVICGKNTMTLEERFLSKNAKKERKKKKLKVK